MKQCYQVDFTEAFWRAVDELQLCRSEIKRHSSILRENPFSGRDIGGRGGNIRVLNVDIGAKKDLRVFYLIDSEIKVALCVFVTFDENPARSRGDDAILLARLAEIFLRIVTGG